ncbi:MAG: DUF6788 family protein [Candidatus Limnocylindrales bacterium]
METTDPALPARLAELEARYRALAAQLAQIGFIARGSVVAAMTTCSSKGCHCQTDPARRHGPYWQVSRSAGGTTRTRRLGEAEARLYQGWIAERHRAEAILAELEELSAQAAAIVLRRVAEEAPHPAR